MKIATSNYNLSRLKQRMQEHFSQLVFQTTKSRGNRELVYSGEMKPSKVVEDIACDYSSQTSSSETDDSKSTFGPKEANMSYATLRELYNVGLSLRNELGKIKNSRYGQYNCATYIWHTLITEYMYNYCTPTKILHYCILVK